MKFSALISVALALLLADAAVAGETVRQQWLLSDKTWQFIGAGADETLPEIDSPEYLSAAWQTVQVPHVFQTRAHFNDITQGWYRRDFTVPPEFSGKHFYLVFEGAATIADVYVNGQHLGQHRGAYTRFVFDATAAMKSGGKNELAVRVDDNPKNFADCLPDNSRLYKVWGGLYRKVWLVAVDPLHIDPTDYGSPGVYITPQNISASHADLSVKVLVRNTLTTGQNTQIRAILLNPEDVMVKTFTESANVPPNERATVELRGSVANPKLWSPDSPNLYHVKVEILRDG